jgi:hypothetical protein
MHGRILETSFTPCVISEGTWMVMKQHGASTRARVHRTHVCPVLLCIHVCMYVCMYVCIYMLFCPVSE